MDYIKAGIENALQATSCKETVIKPSKVRLLAANRQLHIQCVCEKYGSVAVDSSGPGFVLKHLGEADR